jgi:hypothetical protein
MADKSKGNPLVRSRGARSAPSEFTHHDARHEPAHDVSGHSAGSRASVSSSVPGWFIIGDGSGIRI